MTTPPLKMDDGSEENGPIRDSKGRFLPGHPGGPGRPPKTAEENNLELLHEFMDEKKVSVLVQSTLRDALNGSDRARETLFKYLLPEPKQMADVRLLSLQANMEDVMPQQLFAPSDPNVILEGLKSLGELGLLKPDGTFLGYNEVEEVSEADLQDEAPDAFDPTETIIDVPSFSQETP